MTKKSKQSDEVTNNTILDIINRQQQQQQQQQQQNHLFFNNDLENDMRYQNVLTENNSYSGITQSGEKFYIFGTSMISNFKAKKTLDNKLQGYFRACSRL